MMPVRKHVYIRGGKIAYCPTAKMEKEWKKGGMDTYKEFSRAGRLKRVDEEKVLGKLSDLEGELESDDPHVIALALVARVKVLVVQR